MGVIFVSHVGKAYKQYARRWSRMAEWLLPGGRGQTHTLKWILEDISFTVSAGEAVGIIGLNGAGKSTLLKIITGTTQPTTGCVQMNGRVAALLELGMGFHPDFTGRQNVFMASQLLGYRTEDVERLMPEIEAFAEIGAYIDQPVRVYSSGMQVRLAFSVATAIRPDILIVDEALSVGDAYFQHKSFGRIREFRKQGTTLLIVSHDKHAILSICDRAILLNAGGIEKEGDPEAVFDYYNALLTSFQNQSISTSKLECGRVSTRSGTGDAEFQDIVLLNDKNEIVQLVTVGERVRLSIVVRVRRDVTNLVLGCGIKDRLGLMMFGTNTFHTKQVVSSAVAGEIIKFDVSFDVNLGPGSYSVHVSLHRNDSHIDGNFDWRDNALIFEVVNTDKYYFVGCQWNPMRFSVQIGE